MWADTLRCYLNLGTYYDKESTNNFENVYMLVHLKDRAPWNSW